MAITTVVPTVLEKFNTAAAFTATAAVDASDGAKVPMGADQKMLLILENVHVSAEKTATIKAGEGVFLGADLAVTIAAASTKAIQVESGPFQKGGYVFITGTDANIKVAAVRLP